MIIRGFKRKKSTKIYFVIISIILLVYLLLNSTINYIEKIKNKNFKETTYVIFQSNVNYYEKLSNDKKIENLKKCLLLDYVDYDNDLMISENDLLVYELNDKVIVCYDEKQNLKENEIIIGLNGLTYLNTQNSHESFQGKNIIFRKFNIEYDFKIKEIKNTNRKNEILISKEKYELIYSISNENYYTFDPIDEQSLSKLFLKYNNVNSTKIIDLSILNNNDLKIEEQYQDIIFYLTITDYIIVITFLIFLILIIKNIIFDLKTNITLEQSLGYSKLQIKKNLIYRLFYLLSCCLICSYIFHIILVSIFNCILNIEMQIISIYKLSLLIIIISISIIIIVLFEKISLKGGDKK